MMSAKPVFATMVLPGRVAAETHLFVESLREFGGEMADSPFYIFIPEDEEDISPEVRDAFSRLDVRLESFPLKPEAKAFPFAPKVYASAYAESFLSEEAELLVWTDTDVLVIRPPLPFMVSDGVNLAYRPVHHTLIGSKFNEPLTPVWELVYQHCGVEEGNVFPMDTCVRDFVIRPYFNAGLLVVRPRNGLLAAWQDNFDRLYQHPDFVPFYDEFIYKIFIHQIILAGTVLAKFEQRELCELPAAVNYPLNLHEEVPPDIQAATLNDLITVRYDEFERLPEMLGKIEIQEPLKSWLVERFEF